MDIRLIESLCSLFIVKLCHHTAYCKYSEMAETIRNIQTPHTSSGGLRLSAFMYSVSNNLGGR